MAADGKETKVSAALNCIDLSNPDTKQSAALLKEACMDSGFFYVINHGISEELMEEVFGQSKKFFELPMDEKMKLLRNEKHRGYHPPLLEILDHETNKRDDKEAYFMGVELSEDDPDEERPFYGPNIWPPADVFPEWKETMQRYHREVLHVARSVARIIALALDLSVDFFDQPEMLGKPIANFRILRYGGQICDSSEAILGAGAHCDFGILTLLATDETWGLQICKDKDAKPQVWEYVQPLKRAFIVNIGDMLERLSNCVFRSTLHRVVADQERYSIAFFLSPSHDGIIECLPTCKSEENPAKFPPIKCRELLCSRFTKSFQQN
ncbi:2-oxoglutarate (2OG) and Fe(II)-dependent oxygenase superfamily protein [Melia azedarach]|uniref:2-oxoglutarate (2OG) and Fe(II)-dependent oxygenase superfamily protein n=2 Tax=Melia azedarach TaxID=155640 RepID=A0ACC1XRQ7_MELAZ|nr:2-oxoglutarate (2OG) and Fe(II)-dependent oxygenase superfamily protein [Melia azedarach]